MERLTRAEEQVMQVLWKRGPSFVKDVVQAMPSPKPAYTTVSTIIRILEQKGFVQHEAFGKAHRYATKLPKEKYREGQMKRVVKDYFGGSFRDLVSHFMERNDVSAQELDEVLKLIKAKRK